MVLAAFYPARTHFPPERECDGAGFESRRSHLLAQRRETVRVVAVDQYYMILLLIYVFDEIQSAETGAYNYNSFFGVHKGFSIQTCESP